MSFMATEVCAVCFDPISVLVQSEFLKWKAEGLPSDTLSMQNGLIIMHTVQTPFFIDPNTTAVDWLKKHLYDISPRLFRSDLLHSGTVDSINQQEPRLVNALELA